MKNNWQPAHDHRSKPETWWLGRRIKLGREIRTNGGRVFRKGRIAKVTRKYGGLTLEGRDLYVTRVGYRDLSVDVTQNDRTDAQPTP